jgi:cytochrome P450
LLGYLIGGNDTTSNTLAWGLIYLADHPRVQTTLREQLHIALMFAESGARDVGKETKPSPPTYAQILNTSIPYLSAVIEEIMRLSVVIPVLSRRATCDTTVLGHHIPRGTEVEFIFNGPGFLKPGFEVPNELRTGAAQTGRVGDWDASDVGEFKPERWLNSEKEKQGSEEAEVDGVRFNALAGPMLSFGGGPRGCYGKRLAYMEMRILLVLLIWHFEFLPITSSSNSQGGFEEKEQSKGSTRRAPGIVENITTEPGECLVRLRTLV